MSQLKIELELPIEAIKAEMQRAIIDAARQHITRKGGYWSSAVEVKSLIDERWSETVGRIVEEEMANMPKLREQIRSALERKIFAQLTKAIKAVGGAA